jgi:hypothetical protein
MQPESFADVLRSVPLFVSVVTVGRGGAENGLTVSWAAPVSFDPPHFMIAVDRHHYSADFLRSTKNFAVNVLRADQQKIAGQFARQSFAGEDKLAGLKLRESQTGAASSPPSTRWGITCSWWGRWSTRACRARATRSPRPSPGSGTRRRGRPAGGEGDAAPHPDPLPAERGEGAESAPSPPAERGEGAECAPSPPPPQSVERGLNALPLPPQSGEKGLNALPLPPRSGGRGLG